MKYIHEAALDLAQKPKHELTMQEKMMLLSADFYELNITRATDGKKETILRVSKLTAIATLLVVLIAVLHFNGVHTLFIAPLAIPSSIVAGMWWYGSNKLIERFKLMRDAEEAANASK